MEELQTELKAIQAAIRSIRANEPRSTAPSPTVMTATRPARTQPAATELAMEAERLSRLTSTYVKQLEKPKPRAVPKAVPSLDQAFQRLDAQVAEVNQLSTAQEAAILKLKAIAQQVEQDRQTNPSVRSNKTALQLPPLSESGEMAVPHVEKDQHGNFVLTSRSVDLFKAERDAEFNAEVLRHHAIRTRRQPSLLSRLWNWVIDQPRAFQPEGSPVELSQSKTLYSKMQKRSARRSKRPSFNVRQVVFLVVSAIAARVVLDTILALFPGLWLPAIAVMIMPGAIAIYRSTLNPETGLVWGYRLALVLLGLLIGGRL
jgi:hypothetical protein